MIVLMSLALFRPRQHAHRWRQRLSLGAVSGRTGPCRRRGNERRHRRYYQDYLDGSLDIHQFLGFQLEVLGKYEMDTLSGWRAQFLEEKIRPIVLPKAVDG